MACPFCGHAGPLTTEHVFAQWLRRELGTSQRARVSAQVCAECNTGWMSALETSFRSAFSRRRDGTLQPPDRTTIARWATKTASLLALAHEAVLVDDAASLRTGMPAGIEVSLGRRRSAPIDYVVQQRAVAVMVDDLVATVAPVGTLAKAQGTQLWPLRTHTLRWDTLPVVRASAS